MASPKPNVLDKFSSFTYRITWYVCTPEEHNGFIQSGRAGPVGGIIAQSGGVQGGGRAIETQFDYYFNNLKINTLVGGSVTTTVDLSFDVIEPMGFSFINDLKFACGGAKGGLPGAAEILNAAKMYFILGIQFVGYDDQGVEQPEQYKSFYD